MPSESKNSHLRDDEDNVKASAKRTAGTTADAKASAKSAENEADSKDESGPTIVDRVIAFFFENEDFCKTFERFAEEHCDVFDPESEEMQLEYVVYYSYCCGFIGRCV
jgi:hypothetical protein